MLLKADADAIRVHNRRLAIDHLRRFPVTTRKGMSERTGLSLSSASAIASDMIRAGVLREVVAPGRQGRRGRPEVMLELCGGAGSVAAVKISVGEIAISLADYTGAIFSRERRDVELAGLSEEEFVAEVLDLITTHQRELPTDVAPIRRVVVSVQGVTDRLDRAIVWSPILRLRDVDLAGPIERATGAAAQILNDCGLMPERFRWGNELEAADFATLFIGFGVGMGLRLSGRTFRGAQSSAVEFGHLNHVPGGDLCRCGNRGCVEAYAGDYAIWRAAKGGPPGLIGKRVRDADMKQLAEAAREGETMAVLAFERAGQAIGYGLGRIFTLIDPLPIVFVGAGAEAMDLLEESIRKGIRESAIAGVGEDTPFIVMPDVDRVTIEAAVALGLVALDEEFSRAPNTLATEAA